MGTKEEEEKNVYVGERDSKVVALHWW